MIVTVTPETVLKAYEVTGLQPIFGDWGNDITCACAITAVIKHQQPTLQRIQRSWSDSHDVAKAIEAKHEWVNDFINGFDNAQHMVYCSRAYALGQQCRVAVLAKYPDANQEGQP